MRRVVRPGTERVLTFSGRLPTGKIARVHAGQKRDQRRAHGGNSLSRGVAR